MKSGMSPDEITACLRACEEMLLDPAARRHRARVAALLDDDFREFGASGRIWSRDEIVDLLANEEYLPATMENFECRELVDGIALVTYRTVRRGAQVAGTAIILRSSIWAFGNSGWRLLFHQGTRVQ